MNKIIERELVKIVFEFGALKKVVRTGWKNKGIKDPESVAEHSFRCAILAMFLAPQLSLDQNKLVKMALVHDLGEAVIGDLIWERGKKIIGSQKEKHIDEGKAVKEVFGGNPDLQEYIQLWEEFETQKTAEAKIIKQIDKLEMVFQALEYEKEGYSPSNLKEFWDNAEKYLRGNVLDNYFEELKRRKNTST